MSLSESEIQSEPFNEPLAPLPQKKGEKSERKGRPKAVMAELRHPGKSTGESFRMQVRPVKMVLVCLPR